MNLRSLMTLVVALSAVSQVAPAYASIQLQIGYSRGVANDAGAERRRPIVHIQFYRRVDWAFRRSSGF